MLSNCKLEFPGIVYVTLVQVSADRLGVSNLNESDVPSCDLKLPENTCATLDFNQKDKVTKLDADYSSSHWWQYLVLQTYDKFEYNHQHQHHLFGFHFVF